MTIKPEAATIRPDAAIDRDTATVGADTTRAEAAEPTATAKNTRSKARGTRSSAARADGAQTARRTTRRASGTSAAAGADTKAAGRGRGGTSPRRTRSAAETEQIRIALHERLVELCTEHDSMLAQLSDLQRDRLTDSAGDDQADTGTKTLEREQEISLANGLQERITQVERALERLDGGHYGYCERCGNPIPAERLAAFPSVTLCVACKQLEERR